MEFITERNRIYVQDHGKLLAEICFPETDGTAVITHTFVDETLRGQGIAGQLMERATAQINAQGWKLEAVCSYAVKWLDKHRDSCHQNEKL